MTVYPGNTNPRYKTNKYTKIHMGKNTTAFGLDKSSPYKSQFIIILIVGAAIYCARHFK